MTFNTFLYIGGDFTTELIGGVASNGIGKLDTGNTFLQVIWANYGDNGFNTAVRCLEVSQSGYLYIGGDFTGNSANTLGCPYIAIVDSVDNLYCVDNSFSTGYGFTDRVYFIKENTSNPNYLIIGGEFTSFNVASGGYPTIRNAVWHTNGAYDTASNPYEVVSMNAIPRCVTTNGSQFYIGGDFTGLPYGDYWVTFDWDGSNYIVASNPYPNPSSPINLILQDGGIFYTTLGSGYELYDSGSLVGVSPTGDAWSAIIAGIWGQKIFSTISPSQNPIIAYFINSNNAVILSLLGGYSIQLGTSNFTGGITLFDTGSVAELVYNVNNATWYLVSSYNAGIF
jgi:hypothetical protein